MYLKGAQAGWPLPPLALGDSLGIWTIVPYPVASIAEDRHQVVQGGQGVATVFPPVLWD